MTGTLAQMTARRQKSAHDVLSATCPLYDLSWMAVNGGGGSASRTEVRQEVDAGVRLAGRPGTSRDELELDMQSDTGMTLPLPYLLHEPAREGGEYFIGCRN